MEVHDSLSPADFFFSKLDSLKKTIRVLNSLTFCLHTPLAAEELTKGHNSGDNF